MPRCKFCNRSYQRSEHLTRHVTTAHPHPDARQRTFDCTLPGCNRSFNRNDVLRRHMGIHARQQQQQQQHQQQQQSQRQQQHQQQDHRHQPHQSQPPPQQHQREPNHTPSSKTRRPLTSGLKEQRPSKSARIATATTAIASSSTASVLSPAASVAERASPSHPTPRGEAAHALASLLSASPSLQAAASDTGNHGRFHHHNLYSSDAINDSAASDSSCRQGNHAASHRKAVGTAPMEIQADPMLFPSGAQQLPYFGLDTQQLQFDPFAHGNSAALDANNLNGGAGCMLQVPHFDLGGLEWIFEALEESRTSSRAEFSPTLVASDAIGGFEQGHVQTQADGSSDALQAAAGLMSSWTQATGREGQAASGGGQQQTSSAAASKPAHGATREEGGEWPQDYRPASSSLPLFELTQLKLDGFSDDSANASSSGSAQDHRSSASPSSSAHSAFTAASRGPSITILDFEHYITLPPAVPAHCVVSQETRLRLLDFIRHSCKHPWSRYQLSADASHFLTVTQLQTSVSLFFEQFDTHLPFLHKPTFRTDRIPSMLLLVIITIGLVFLTRAVTMRQQSAEQRTTNASTPGNLGGGNRLAIALSEIARISVVSAVESDLQGFMHMWVTQSWLLQQMFGLGCGDKRLFQLAERNRTGIATFVRRLGFLRTRHTNGSVSPKNASRSGHQTPAAAAAAAPVEAASERLSLEQRWRSWIEIECRIRLGWAVYLYDQGYPMCFDLPPVLVYSEVANQLPCEEALWTADSCFEWAKLMEQHAANDGSHDSAEEDEAASLASTLSDRTSDFLNTLQSFLQHKSTAVRINKFGALILATTFHRLMWDHSKQELLLGWSAPTAGALDTTPCSASTASSVASTLGSRASSSLAMLAQAAGVTLPTPSFHHHMFARHGRRSGFFGTGHADAMISDLLLIKMLSDLHFGFPPRLFDELKDAAGRFGFQTEGHREAHSWLRKFFAQTSHRICIEKGVTTALHIYHFSAANSSEAANGGGHVDHGVNHVIAVFHSALLLWGYLSYQTSSTSVEATLGSPEAATMSAVQDRASMELLGGSIGQMLTKFMDLLDCSPWALARSFRAVLQRLALHDVQP